MISETLLPLFTTSPAHYNKDYFESYSGKGIQEKLHTGI